MTFRPVVSPALCQERLRQVFPPAAFDTVLANPQAARGVAAMIYVGSVVPDEGEHPQPDNVWTRPSTVMNMSDEALARDDEASRRAWAAAEARGVKQVAGLLASWGLEHRPWYAPNSREGLRDETWKKWRTHGAARDLQGLPSSSSRPRWALTASFADLFDPSLEGEALADAIERWRRTHMAPGDLIKIQHANDLARADHEVEVSIPGYGTRRLEPGAASAILKGVIEEWAPRRLHTPVVVAISEPRAKVWRMDAEKMAAVGLSINVSSVLPDAILVDAGTRPHPTFWIVEAVATDGEVNEERRRDLLDWAATQYIPPEHCQFLSAFTSRNSPPARRRLKDIAVGTYCWFLDEPSRHLSVDEIPPPQSP